MLIVPLQLLALPRDAAVPAAAFAGDSISARHLRMTSAATGAAAQYETSEVRSMFLQCQQQSGQSMLGAFQGASLGELSGELGIRVPVCGSERCWRWLEAGDLSHEQPFMEGLRL